ncbi:Cgr1 family [Pyrrhoderma noxium]|uniref:rRNA-processing protein n=1 Tax=Pyrrhoderma noxium TaxID=2282107 RepID=A0A286URU9_9AGAM|nr:Cgr1 family [Pyrrhoderma noxium]
MSPVQSIEPLALAPSAAGRESGKSWKSQKSASKRSHFQPNLKTTKWEARMEKDKAAAAMKKLERELKEEKQAELKRRREVTMERKKIAEEKQRLEEAKALMGARKAARMRRKAGRTKKINQ